MSAGLITRAGLLPKAPAVDPGSAVPPDAPHQPHTVSLYATQVAWDLAPKPFGSVQAEAPGVSTSRWKKQSGKELSTSMLGTCQRTTKAKTGNKGNRKSTESKGKAEEEKPLFGIWLT